MRIGLLNNLRAGRSDAQTTRLLRSLGRYPEVLHVETDSGEALPEALTELWSKEIDLLVVNGGDGTLQHALTLILGSSDFNGHQPLIAPLRGGRTNMTASDLGAGRDSVKGLAKLIEASRDGSLEDHVVERRVMRVEYGRQREAIYGMFAGMGVIHRAIEFVHRALPKGHQGVFGASLVTGHLLLRAGLNDHAGVLAPDKLQIMADGEMVDGGEFTLAIGSTLHRLFAGMRPFWGEGPGCVKFTTMHTGARKLWRTAPGILAGRAPKQACPENGYESRNSSRVEIRMDCGFTVDGELVAPEVGRTLTLTAHDTVRFVRA